MFDEKGHRGMALTFYLTGKERSGVVGVKVQKVIYYSSHYSSDYQLLSL
jgi:hypothetical protein